MLLCCCLGLWYCTDLPKVIAPRLRKAEEAPDPVTDFFDRGDAVMEDHDPELAVNPVWMARMQAQREKEAAKKRQRGLGGGFLGGPGALARLGIRIAPVEQAETSPGRTAKEKGPRYLKQIDKELEKQQKEQLKAGGGGGGGWGKGGGGEKAAAASSGLSATDAARALTKQRKLAEERLNQNTSTVQQAAQARQGARHAAALGNEGSGGNFTADL